MTEVPQIHLINLDRSADRLRRFWERNKHLPDVIRVAATDGAKIDRKQLIQKGYIADDLPYGPGTLGCAMSHIKLWEIAATQDRCVTIFEDDVVVSHQFAKRAGEVLSAVPADWDIVQWGYNFNPTFLWVDLLVCKARIECYGPPNYLGDSGAEAFQTADILPSPVRLLHSFGLQGYSISAKGARAALDYCLPLRNRMIEFPDAGVRTQDVASDIALAGLYPNLKAFICIPQLVLSDSQHESVRELGDRQSENETRERA